MRHRIQDTIPAAAVRFLTGTLLLALLASAAAADAAASTTPSMQIIPSIGLAKGTDANASDAKVFGGLALRAALLPFLSVEGAINYRQESFFDDNLTVRMWPVSASLWLTPVPAVYAGGGVGWYRTTYDLESNVLFEDLTTNKLGLHLGGGVALPLTPSLGLDLGGRYVFMQEDDELEWPTEWPTEFNPDFWNVSLGLAIKF